MTTRTRPVADAGASEDAGSTGNAGSPVDADGAVDGRASVDSGPSVDAGSSLEGGPLDAGNLDACSGKCAPILCEAGKTFCESSGRLSRCWLDGTFFTPLQWCGSDQICDPDQGACANVVCAASSRTCNGDKPTKCNAYGTASVDEPACGPGTACADGACQAVVCNVGERRCDSQNNLLVCNSTRTSFDVQVCKDTNAFCDATATPACHVRRCTPGQPVCDGERATTCDDLGSGPLSNGGTDCAASAKVCASDATCKAVICHGSYDCVAGSLHQCSDKGTVAMLYETCEGQTSVCQKSGNDALCVPACPAGAPTCNGNFLTTCQSDGSGPALGGTDCTEAGQVCDPNAATCAPKICEPHTSYCKNGDVYQCTRSGAADGLFATCTASQYCKQYATSAYCEADVCTGGEPFQCTGNVANLCKVDGSGPEPSIQVDCGVSNESFCYQGVDPNLCEKCPLDYYSNGTRCLNDVCPQGQPACFRNRTTTCNTRGSDFDPGGVDCSASGMVCDGTVQCSGMAIDSVGSKTCSAFSSADWGTGLVYRVDSDRHLTNIEMYLGLYAPGPVAWYVYESTNAADYNLIFDLTVSMLGSSTAHPLNSGPIDVHLVAGRYYMIGVGADNGLIRCTDFNFYYVLTTSFGQYLSIERTFGAGGLSATLNKPLQVNRANENAFQQLTTTL